MTVCEQAVVAHIGHPGRPLETRDPGNLSQDKGDDVSDAFQDKLMTIYFFENFEYRWLIIFNCDQKKIHLTAWYNCYTINYALQI